MTIQKKNFYEIFYENDLMYLRMVRKTEKLSMLQCFFHPKLKVSPKLTSPPPFLNESRKAPFLSCP